MTAISAGTRIHQEKMGSAALAYPGGRMWFVDSTNGSNGRSGSDWRNALATLAQAVAKAEAGDTIILAPGGSDTLTATITISVAKVRVVCPVKNPDSGYTLTGAGTVDLLTVSAADVAIEGLRFTRTAGAGSTTAGILTTAGADRLLVKKCAFDCTDLTSAWTNYGVEVTDDAVDVHITECVFKDCHRSVLFATGAGKNCARPRIENCTFFVGQATAFGIHASPTGTVRAPVVQGCLFLEADGSGAAATAAWNGTDGTDATRGPILYGANVDQYLHVDCRAYTALNTAWANLHAINAGAAGSHVDCLTAAAQSVAAVYSDTTAIHTQTTTIASDVVLVYSDTTAVHSDTTAIHTQTTAVYSDTTAVHTQTTTIASDLVIVASDVSQAGSDLLQVYSDTTIILSDLVIVASDVLQVYSDTTVIASDLVIITSDTTAMHTQTTTIASDLVIIASDLLQVYSDSTIVVSDTTAIHAQTTTIASDLVIIASDLLQVYSDSTIIASDLVIITSDTTAIHTQTTTIASDLVIIASDLLQVYSDTTIIASDLVIVASDVLQVYSDSTVIASDLVIMRVGVPLAKTITIADTSLGNNVQNAGDLVCTATGGDVMIEEIIVAKDVTPLAGPTNIECTTTNTYGETGINDPVASNAIAALGAQGSVRMSVGGVVATLPFVLESTKALYIHGDDAAGSSAGNVKISVIGRGLNDGAYLA